MPSKITGIYGTCLTTNCSVMCTYYPIATYLLMTFPAVTILSVAHCTPPHHVLPGDMERYSQCLPLVHVQDIVLFTPPRRRSACVPSTTHLNIFACLQKLHTCISSVVKYYTHNFSKYYVVTPLLKTLPQRCCQQSDPFIPHTCSFTYTFPFACCISITILPRAAKCSM